MLCCALLCVYTLQELAAEYLHDGIHLSSAGSSVLFEGVLTVLFIRIQCSTHNTYLYTRSTQQCVNLQLLLRMKAISLTLELHCLYCNTTVHCTYTAELRRVILEAYPQLNPEAMRMQAPWHGDVDTDNLETILDHI
jgi:hypothetical protein